MITVAVQRFLLPDPDAPTELYFRQSSAGPGAFCSGPDEVTVPAGARLTSDTYFNAIFSSHWEEHTCVEKFKLRLELSGRCRLRVLRTSLTQRSELARVDIPGPKQHVELEVPIEAAAGGEPGILFFEISAFDRTKIYGARWYAEAVAARRVRLVAGCCTYRREEYLIRNLANLIADPEVMDHLAAIVVVDNDSSTMLAERLSDLSPLVRLRQQGNVGGAGGFTRVLLEGLSTGEATHVLLMDDDVRLTSEALFRARAFLMVATELVCLGGHMLDLLRPGLLAEAGARADFGKLTVDSQCAGLPLVDHWALWTLARPHEVDYNAWWFCVLPLEAVRVTGFPLPVFIRGDDIEYGCRLKAKGVRTLVPPGIAIWHEPFDAKLGGWQSYFATRNFLIAAACHEDVWAKSASKVLLRRVVNSLLVCDYYEAWLHCEAAADFMIGPRILDVDPAAVLAKLVANRSVHQKKSKKPGMRPLPLRSRFLFSRRLRKLERRWQILRHWAVPARPGSDRHVEGYVAAPHAAWWNLASRDHFLLERWFSFDLEVRRRDPQIFREQMTRVRALQRRLRSEEAALCDYWRRSFPELTSERSWRKRLGMSLPESAGHDDAPQQHAEATPGRASGARAAAPVTP